jgi:hypothetical protein
MIIALPRRADETARDAFGADVVFKLLESAADIVTQRLEPAAGAFLARIESFSHAVTPSSTAF